MALLNAETRSKIFVVLIIAGCVGAAILIGVAIFELPWNQRRYEKEADTNNYSSLALPQVDNELEKIQNSNRNNSEKVKALLEIYPGGPPPRVDQFFMDIFEDLPWNLRNFVQNDLRRFNFTDDLTQVEPWASYNESYTDIPRLRKGRVGAQFWVAYSNCESQGKDAVVQVLEQIDVIHRLVEEYPDHLRFCTSAQCIIETSFNTKNAKIASLIGVEGGHLIQSSPGVLRQLYNLGARYLTLTHACNTPWADASPVDDPTKHVLPMNEGLSQFGLELIDEMNRIGMTVDLSHVSELTMIAALKRSRAPVIFSHSGAKAICNIHRNVGDEVLKLLKKNGGVIMINFYSEFINCDPAPRVATISDVVSHIEHIRDVIGVDHIGIGGDYDGVDSMPKGLEDVSKYPELFETLLKRGWLLTDLKKISFTNIIRVMEAVENFKNHLDEQTVKQLPMQSIIPEEELNAKLSKVGDGFQDCSSSKSFSKLLVSEQNKHRQDSSIIIKQGDVANEDVATVTSDSDATKSSSILKPIQEPVTIPSYSITNETTT